MPNYQISIKLRVHQKEALKADIVRLYALNGLRKAANRVKWTYQGVVSNWSHRPTFYMQERGSISLRGGVPSFFITTDDDVFRYVDRGTPAHTIRARRGRFLVFQAGYKARTTPHSISSGASSEFGPRIMRPSVRHPGIKARDFSGVIAKVMEKEVRSIVQDAISQGMRRR
jgi:hypothetical protein